jgi:hypothetical protein
MHCPRVRRNAYPKWKRLYALKYEVLQRVNDINYVLQIVGPKRREIISHVNKLRLLSRESEKPLMMVIKTGLCYTSRQRNTFLSWFATMSYTPAANELIFQAIRSVKSCILLFVILTTQIQFSQLL